MKAIAYFVVHRGSMMISRSGRRMTSDQGGECLAPRSSFNEKTRNRSTCMRLHSKIHACTRLFRVGTSRVVEIVNDGGVTLGARPL